MAAIQSWSALDVGGSVYHVQPIDDLREHEDSAQCWCRPSVEEEEEGTLIVHNSMDGREAFESGERLPS
jgi:hypothetical protein